jgi:putative membrane protein
MMMGYGWGGWGGAFWMIGGLLLLIGVIVLVVWAVMTLSRGGGHTPTQEPPRPTPNDILRERFARGEISEQEFEQAKKVLGPDR